MGAHVNTVWADEHSEALVTMLANGMSFAEIAAALNDRFKTNYTRNAACGKGFRLKVRAPAKIRAPRKPRNRKLGRAPAVKSINKAEEIRLRCVEIEPRHLTLEQLAHNDCRYPFGEEAPYTFCGRHVVKDRPYCLEHQKLVTTPSRNISESVSEARATIMRKRNFRQNLLQGLA